MNDKEIVRSAMKVRGFNQAMLAEKMGMKTQSGVSERLRGSTTMRVDTFVKFLNTMGFDVIVKDRNSKGKNNTWIVGDSEVKEATDKPGIDLDRIFGGEGE